MSDDTDKAAREWVGGINFSSIFTAEDMVLAFIAGATHERSRPILDDLWGALKKQCASDPDRAKALVMVRRDDLAAALQRLRSQG